jgi:hypothetical protein
MAFGVTGNATKFMFYEIEETVMDSPIRIEPDHIIKIAHGYAQVD